MINIMKTKYDEGIEYVAIRCLKQVKTINEVSDIIGLLRNDEKIKRKMNEG